MYRTPMTIACQRFFSETHGSSHWPVASIFKLVDHIMHSCFSHSITINLKKNHFLLHGCFSQLSLFNIVIQMKTKWSPNQESSVTSDSTSVSLATYILVQFSISGLS